MTTDPKFEPEVVFPSNPAQAAIMFFAVIAYPGYGAGRPGGAGLNFSGALSAKFQWSVSKAKGLRFLRERFDDPSYRAPQRREFMGAYLRGRRRLKRREVAYSLYGTQMLNGFFNVRTLGAKAIQAGRPEEVYHVTETGQLSAVKVDCWKRAMPSIRKVLSKSNWSKRFGLNRTGPTASAAQKVKDDYERAFLPSVPVLHLVHALNICMSKYGPSMEGWGKGDVVMTMIFNADLWIWEAISLAEQWRNAPNRIVDYLQSNRMIVVKRQAVTGPV